MAPYTKGITIIDHSGKQLSQDEVDDCVVQLRELVSASKGLQGMRTDTLYLLRFLHCTDFNVHLAFRRVEDFGNLIIDNPDWFASGSPLDYKHIIDQNTRAALPHQRDREGRQLFISKIGNIDGSKMSARESAILDDFWLESVLDEPQTLSKGLSVILDMKGYSWSVFRWLTPQNIKIGSKKADLYPLKELVYHVVNTSVLINASVKLVWPFLSSKIKDRMKFHFDDWNSLHKHIDPAILPPEYGGTGPSYNFEKLNEMLYAKSSELAEKLKFPGNRIAFENLAQSVDSINK